VVGKLEKNEYRVLLFYKYVKIDEPEVTVAEHLKKCKEIGLKGRIFIGSEGINGTCSGTVEQTDAYKAMMDADENFKDIIYKVDEVDAHVFKKMHVRVREQIVNLSLEDDINPHEITGNYLKPEQFLEQMQDENTIVIDARNDYEFDVGHFRGAIRPDIRTFRELPQWIRDNKEQLDGKKVLTYCTGGIRCEKFSGWLVREGYEDVGQLEGGIVTYGKDPVAKGQLWDGQCYVFDERLTVPVNQVEHVIVGRDHFDNEPCERYVNCANPICNEQIICSEENEHFYLRSCTDECRVHPRNRYFIEHDMTVDEFNERMAAIEKLRKETQVS